MYIMLEGFLLVVYYATKERFMEFFMLSRRVHGVRERRLKEFAEICCPREDYIGKPGGYWKAVKRYRRQQYLLMAMIVILIIVACIIVPPEV